MGYKNEMKSTLDLQKLVETVTSGAASSVSIACKQVSTVSMVWCVNP